MNRNSPPPGPPPTRYHESMSQTLTSPKSPTVFMYPMVPLTIVGTGGIACVVLEISDFAIGVGPRNEIQVPESGFMSHLAWDSRTQPEA
jgi:hypothetical protein